MSTPRHRIIALVLAVIGSVTLSGCVSTNFNAQTDQQYQAAVGANVRDGDIQIYNALFVDNEDGTATLSGALLADNSDEKIVGAEVSGHTVNFGSSFPLVQDTLFTVGPDAEVVVDLGGVEPGHYLDLKLTAESGSTVLVKAPVVERTERYDSVAGGSAVATD